MTEFNDKGYFALTLAPFDEDAYIDSGTFYSFSEALRAAIALDRENPGRGVYLSESAVFTVGRTKKNELVQIWWNKEYADAIEDVPRGRGSGYYSPDRGKARFVDYEPDPAFQEEELEEEIEEEAEEVDHEEDDDYVKTHCDFCGKIMPLYEANEYQREVEAGRSSGSSRSGSSSGRRTSTKGKTSYSSSSSSSRSSGRTYYKTETLQLCTPCFESQVRSDWIWLGLKIAFYGAIGIAVLAFYFANK